MNIFVVPIEPLETRYTCEWYDHVPNLLEEEAERKGINATVYNIPGIASIEQPTEGAFLDFAGTNIYKSEQLISIAHYFRTGKVEDGDVFLFTDAWNPAIIQVRYMAELLQKKVKLVGLWHAGSYDSQDFLGRLIKDKKWSYDFERSLFHALDYSCFATQYHIDLFTLNLFDDTIKESQKIIRTGWPMEYMPERLSKYRNSSKEDLILFPHRLAPEKQVEIFKLLEKEMPQYKWIVCQEKKLKKFEYHELLGKAKVVFSANLQETLGISMWEGALCGATPLVPNRLSYAEMFRGHFPLYPSDWTKSLEEARLSVRSLKNLITYHIEHYDDQHVRQDVDDLADHLSREFFNSEKMLEVIFQK